MFKAVIAVAASLMVASCGMFGGDDSRSDLEARSSTLGVNGYLWQAALDTLFFMPILQPDPASAVIATDWQAVPDNPDERVRVTVRILTEQLRSDGVRVTVMRQERKDGTWVLKPVQASTALKIEEAILTQARALRVARLGS